MSSAQKMIDVLMRTPVVAVRVSLGNSFASSWIVMAKEGGTNYSQLASVMASIVPSSATTAAISKERLKALTRLASTASDRRLIELAALDQVSCRRMRELSGRCHETAADQRQREQQLAAATETMLAYEHMARLDTLAEINALLGGAEITDEDLQREVDKLKVHDEEVERTEEDAMLLDPLPFVSYQHEDVGKELKLEADFYEVITPSPCG